MISGHTKLFFLLADPVAHVRTPQKFNDHLARAGIDAVCVALHVPAGQLATVVGALREVRNLSGIIVTIPHKIAIIAHCDDLHDSARLVGAVNIVRREHDGRLVGGNFDGAGFVSALEAAVGPLRGRSVYIAGAGGVARAIAFCVARAGAGRLAIYNRSAAKADALLGAVSSAFPAVATERGEKAPGACDVAINGTSLGLEPGDPLPFDIDTLPAGAAVAEVVMQPLMTALLERAQARGLRIVTGDGMLDHQLAAWVEFIGERLRPDAAHTPGVH